VTTLMVFRLHLSVLLPCEWWGRIFLNHSKIEAVLIKRQPGDSPRITKPNKLLCFRMVSVKENQSINVFPNLLGYSGRDSSIFVISRTDTYEARMHNAYLTFSQKIDVV